MAQLLRLASGGDRPSAQRDVVLRSNRQWRDANSAVTDHDLARTSKANVFVVGAEDETAELVASLRPCLFTPIVVRRRGEPLRLEPAAAPAGTIVVYDVETLTSEEQDALNQWLGAARGRVRVVSCASRSLLPAVEAGDFNDALYYRLNVVTIHLPTPVAS
jgi:sigma-54-interacting transcriptional regulator